MKKRSYVTIDPKNISTPELHSYLLAAVAPRPIALASTIDKEGNVNLSPFSFFNVFSANPPIMIFSPSRRGTDNTPKHTFENVMDVPEVVINVVNYPIVEQVSLSSTMYAKGVNEFLKSGLTAIPSDIIAPPRVAESPVAFECVVNNVIELGKEAGAGNLVVSKVIKMHIDEEVLGDNGKIETTKLDLVGRMGGIYYNRASGDALFTIPKPLRTKGIGVDELPDHVRNSHILSGNDLGRLGNMPALPTADNIEIVSSDEKLRRFIRQEDIESIHKKAKTLISTDQVSEALALLFAVRPK